MADYPQDYPDYRLLDRTLPQSVFTNPPIPPHLRGRVGAGVLADPSSPVVKPPFGAQPPGAGGGSIWDALRSLFSGASSVQGQGMTGILQRGQAGAGTDQLGNPLGRF
jgi:hypothetical protein